MGLWSRECCTMREIFRQLIAGQRTDEPGGFNCSALSVKLNSLFSLGCSTLCISNCLAGEKIINNQGCLVSVVRFRDCHQFLSKKPIPRSGLLAFQLRLCGKRSVAVRWLSLVYFSTAQRCNYISSTRLSSWVFQKHSRRRTTKFRHP